MADTTQACTAEDLDAAIWLQIDACYLYGWARLYRDRGNPGDEWLAPQVQENAALSAKMARQRLGIEPEAGHA